MKFSNLLSKSVLSLYNGSNEGVVISGYFDDKLKKLIALEVVSQDDSTLTDEYLLFVKNIYNIGQDAITIKNNSLLDLKITAKELNDSSPINCLAYKTNGELIGKITDIDFDDKFSIKSFIIEHLELDASKVASHSKGTIIFYDEEFKTKVEKLRPSIARIKIKENDLMSTTLPKTYIMPAFETESINQEALEEQKQENEKPNLQKFETTTETNKPNLLNARIDRLTANTNLLIGKKITRTIATANGELIGKKGNLITSKTIYLATAHQKLRELILYCE
ncbi:MAG: PRC-barrel domain-containing protein [Clostridia bacterium]|nr:PRC-barrel domain-containing protein [Clostridia bacterium]